MDGQVRLYLWTAIVVAVVAAAIVHMWPYRRFREIVIRRRIAAPREQIWDTYVTDLDNPLSAAFHDTLVSSRTVSTDPEITEFVSDASGRHGTHHSSTLIETLVSERPEHTAVRCIRIDDQPPPFGENNVEEMKIMEGPDGTEATITWRGETKTLGQYRARRSRLNQYMDSLKTFCETGQGTSVPQSNRSTWKSIGLTALAFASFMFLFGWAFALILSVTIAVHEFGHWLAMRMTGQPKPRIMLVPFFGGVAVPNHPHKSQFDGAFVYLAGAGISMLPCLALLAAAYLLGTPDLAKAIKFGKPGAIQVILQPGLVALAMLIGALNALQLLPILPLDGGHILRSFIQSMNARLARPALLTVTAAGIAGFAYLGDYILAAIFALGLMQAWHLGGSTPTARAMGPAGMAAIGIGYAVTFAVHAGAVIYGLRFLGIALY